MSKRIAFGVVLFGVANVSLGCSRQSPTGPSVIECSTAALRGSYGSQRNGQAAPGTALTSLGLATFDGLGHMIEQMTVSTSGVFSTLTNQRSAYTIGSDCTGTLTDDSGNRVAILTMVHGNDEVLGMSVEPGSNVALHFERIDGTCSNATLKGVYGFQRNGQTGPGVPLLAIGTVTFDGIGNATVTQTVDSAGTIRAPITVAGPYVVNGDCTATHSLAGGVIPMIVVHGGDEALGMSLTPGNNVVVHFERTH